MAKLVGSKVAEIARSQGRGEPHADVGRRSAAGYLHAQRELRIVGRQPVRIRANQIVEVAPGAACLAPQVGSLAS